MIRFINPNYHVILIHYPIALLSLGLLIELLAMLRPIGSLRAAAQWMILIGALACAPAATSGIFAKYDILQKLAGDQSGNWQEIKSAAHLSGLQWHYLNLHVLCSAVGAAVASLAAILWLGSSPQWPRPLGAPLFLILATSMILMGLGAYNAGEIIYRTGFATQTQDQSDKLQNDWSTQTASAPTIEKWQRRADYYVDTLQAHIIAAGIVFALAAAGLGLTLQKSARLRAVPPVVEGQEPPPLPLSPAAGFWLLTALAALLTALGGWYVFAHDLNTPLWNLRAAFESQIWQPYQKDSTHNARMLAHLGLGGGIAIVALLFAPLARWCGKARLLISLLGLVMIAAVAAQIYVGMLMLYDTDSGPIMHFNPASNAGGAGVVSVE